MHKLFVYGTLRKGRWSHRWLQKSRYLGLARTCQKYALYAAGIPWVSKQEPVSPIVGELYEISEDTLSMIDLLENHPHSYRREEVDVRLEDGGIATAWLYFMHRQGGTLIPSGDYTDWITQE
jgi:gamma-glutamylcyclotransferase (GGCT)/AIG2-like uncharacterized protein YtfP